MGMLSRHFADPRPDVIDGLLRAFADEWFGHYNYNFVAHMVRGPASASIATLLRGKSEQALDRAERLATRLIQLGSEPVRKLTDLPALATDKPFKLPNNLSDVDALLRAVLDAERTSMRTHQRLYELTRDSDPLTAALSLQLLAEAATGEQQLERLLGDEAPQMTGA